MVKRNFDLYGRIGKHAFVFHIDSNHINGTAQKSHAHTKWLIIAPQEGSIALGRLAWRNTMHAETVLAIHDNDQHLKM